MASPSRRSAAKAALAANARAEPSAPARELGQPQDASSASRRPEGTCSAWQRRPPSARFAAGLGCLGARNAAGWNRQGWCADGEFGKLGRAVGAGRALGPADGLACGWPGPRHATGRFSAEVACQHGLWLAPAFAAGFKRGWRGESRLDAKRRVGSTDATEFLRCSRGVPPKMDVHQKWVPTVPATPWCASEKGVGLLAATRSIFGAAGQAWRRSAVGGRGTTDS